MITHTHTHIQMTAENYWGGSLAKEKFLCICFKTAFSQSREHDFCRDDLKKMFHYYFLT